MPHPTRTLVRPSKIPLLLGSKQSQAEPSKTFASLVVATFDKLEVTFCQATAALTAPNSIDSPQQHLIAWL